jgi:hypothetical protein
MPPTASGVGSMKSAWCWRCKRKVPMLDEGEYASVTEAYPIGSDAVKRARVKESRALLKGDEDTLYREVIHRYRELTGASDMAGREVMKHRLSLLGPPCENCGKELRTPLARKCVEWGHVLEPMTIQS